MITANRRLTTVVGFLTLLAVFATAISFTADVAAKKGLDLFKVVSTNDLNGYAQLWGYSPMMYILLIIVGCVSVFTIHTSRR